MTTNKSRLRMLGLAAAALLTALPALADNYLPAWAFGGFERPEGVNPLITPNVSTSFSCPMRGQSVAWECACILYRAEDDPNAGIGGRTSRIGYAESADGVHLDSRQATPVFYPDGSDISRTYEWKGGCEDPRVVAANVKGKTLYVMTYTAWNNRTPRLAIATSTDLQQIEKKGISASDIRSYIYQDKDWKHMVPNSVYKYIKENKIDKRIKSYLTDEKGENL